jgi:hypothetical protein
MWKCHKLLLMVEVTPFFYALWVAHLSSDFLLSWFPQSNTFLQACDICRPLTTQYHMPIPPASSKFISFSPVCRTVVRSLTGSPHDLLSHHKDMNHRTENADSATVFQVLLFKHL